MINKKHDLKKIPTKYSTKFKHDKDNRDIILKNGKRVSEIFKNKDFSISGHLKDLNGIPTETIYVYIKEPLCKYIVLGYTGDFVRDEKGEPMPFKTLNNSLYPILKKTDVIEVKRASDKKENILSPDGTFLLKEWYDDIIYVPKSNLFIVSDNDKFNLAKLGGGVLSDKWYVGMERVSNKCFLCMDKETKKYIMNDKGKLEFDGRGFDITTILKISLTKDYFGGKKFDGKIVCCVDTTSDDSNVKLITEDLEVIDYGRSITEVNKLSSGIYMVVDSNENCNIIGDKFKLISDNWFTKIDFNDDISSAYINDSDFIIFGSKSLVTLNKSTIFTAYKIERSDPIDGLFLCVKRKDRKCNVYIIPKLQNPIFSNWTDDVYKTDNGFLYIRDGELYYIIMCLHTNRTTVFTIDGKNIYNMSPNKYCVQKSDGKFSFGYYENTVGYNAAHDPLEKDYVFDNVYDLSSMFPIVEKDNMFNVFDVSWFLTRFDKWYDDIEPIDDNGYFNCLSDGKWEKIKVR